MAFKIVRVELRGDPPSDIHDALHTFMRDNGWSQTITTESLITANLPTGMYCGTNRMPPLMAADTLKVGIEAIWPQGSIVLVINVDAWGINGSR